MTAPSPAQVNALRKICDAIEATVREGGPIGAPAGVMYAAMSAQGCSLQQFQGIMSLMVRAGRLVQDGDLYHVAACVGGK